MRDGIDVEVREVGLRDGIQGIKTFFPTEGKRAWIAAEARAGVPEIEACSLVPTGETRRPKLPTPWPLQRKQRPKCCCVAWWQDRSRLMLYPLSVGKARPQAPGRR